MIIKMPNTCSLVCCRGNLYRAVSFPSINLTMHRHQTIHERLVKRARIISLHQHFPALNVVECSDVGSVSIIPFISL